MIYIPLIFIFVAARSILPDLANAGRGHAPPGDPPGEPLPGGPDPGRALRGGDEHRERLPPDRRLGPGAATSTSGSSGPTASEREIEWASYAATVARRAGRRGVVACRPPQFLQLIIVFSLERDGRRLPDARPAGRLLAAGHRRRGHRRDARGAGATMALYVARLRAGDCTASTRTSAPSRSGFFAAYYLLGLDPCVWGLLVVDRRRDRGQPADPPARPGTRRAAVRPAAPGRPGPGVARRPSSCCLSDDHARICRTTSPPRR